MNANSAIVELAVRQIPDGLKLLQSIETKLDRLLEVATRDVRSDRLEIAPIGEPIRKRPI
jgi:hypothetical protein